jgi:hypothetical protein
MTRPTLRFAFLAFTALISTTSLRAQAPGPTPDQLKSWIGVRQQRVDLLRDEIKQIDTRIESRVDVIVDTLKTITDSKDSGTKVARMKEDTGKRLMKTIEYYDQKRAALRQELRNPQTQLTASEKQRMIAVFDERIAKRTKQILDLNKSMPGHKDYERYTATGSGWHGTEYQRNENFEQNRRMTSHSNTQRDAIVKQLDASIARLDRLGRELRTQLAATTDPAQHKERAAEVAKNDALIAERRKQRVETLQAPDFATRNVALKEAMDMDQAMKRATDELRRDFTTLFQRYNTLLGEFAALHATEATLAASARPRG